MNLRRRGQINTGRSVKGVLIEEVLQNHLIPLHDHLQSKMRQESEFVFGWKGDQLAKELLDLSYNGHIAAMLKDIGTLLWHIYKTYFPQELVRLVRNHQKDTEKSLYNFLRDFEIFPGKTKKSQILHIFVFTRE